MPLSIGALRETTPGENRVALVPDIAAKFTGLGAELVIETNAGLLSRHPDEAYAEARIANTVSDVVSNIDVLLAVQPLTKAIVEQMKPGAVIVGFMQAHAHPELVKSMQTHGITSFSVELIPRISRAQSMDALSSQASVSGYVAALIAAQTLDKFLPMLTTAAGTIRPAQVLVIGAGVAGLQAIATVKRLGAIVEGYDVRPETKEQVHSLGARFVDTGVSAAGEGGYARELTDEEKNQQQEVLAQHIAAADAVITTAAIPGRQAPTIIPADVVRRMKTGAVIVDLAAESGGNCELTRAGETVEENGVRIVGPVNLPAQLASHASEMYSRNLLNFLQPAIKEGELSIDWEDEVFAGAVLTHDGEIRHEPTRELIAGGGA